MLEAVVVAAAAVALQAAPPVGDSARCDSIVAASRVDSVPSALFVFARRFDGPPLDEAQTQGIIAGVISAFTPPKPFRLGVFSGPSASRSLRALNRDTLAVPRAPTMTGVYRFTSTAAAFRDVNVVRVSRVMRFDSIAVEAIRAAATGDPAFLTPAGVDSMRVDVHFSTDSSAGSQRYFSAYFPRMPVVDAVPLAGNPPPVYPEAARADSLAGEVVMRFVVDRDGTPDFSTIELVRATDLIFIRAALAAIAKLRFRPAGIHGCPVAQQIDYAMTFVP